MKQQQQQHKNDGSPFIQNLTLHRSPFHLKSRSHQNERISTLIVRKVVVVRQWVGGGDKRSTASRFDGDTQYVIRY